jgi:hypothetical protein
MMKLMNTVESTRRPMSLRDVVYIGIISFFTPIVAQHNGLPISFNNNSSSKEEIVSSIKENYGTNVLFEIEKIIRELESSSSPPNKEYNITWLDSPVTQKWEYDYRKGYWTTQKNNAESFRSPPTIQIGLREDGVVIWKTIKEK